MEAYIRRGRFIENLEYVCLMIMSFDGEFQCEGVSLSYIYLFFKVFRSLFALMDYRKSFF